MINSVIDEIQFCIERCDAILRGQVETTPSSNGETICIEHRKMHMGDAKIIAKSLKIRLTDIFEKLEQDGETNVY